MIRIVSLCISVLLFISCTRDQSVANISMDAAPVISREQRVALVVDPYIALRDQPGDSGITVSHARRGEVFLVTGTRIVETAGDRVLWISLGNRWVVGESLQFYSSEARARAAGKLLKNVPAGDDLQQGIEWQ